MSIATMSDRWLRRKLRQVGEGDLGAPRHPTPNSGLADFDAELEQFPVDAGRPPQRVGIAHAADQSADFCPDLGSSRTA
jgi:hypothetical protein